MIYIHCFTSIAAISPRCSVLIRTDNLFQWNNRVTMAILRPDCYLDLFDGANLTDSHRYLGGDTSEGNVYDLSWYSFANRTSSYYCQCHPWVKSCAQSSLTTFHYLCCNAWNSTSYRAIKYRVVCVWDIRAAHICAIGMFTYYVDFDNAYSPSQLSATQTTHNISVAVSL